MANIALIVGIDYIGTENQLPGCGNDARDMGELLKKNGFTTTILTDVKRLAYSDGSQVKVAGLPTKTEIMLNLGIMTSKAKPGDTVVFYNSSHGTQIPSGNNGSEQDFIVALDALTHEFNIEKLISSDELHQALIKAPPGVKVLIVADSCFSGNITEFEVKVRGLNKELVKQVVPFKHLRALLDAHARSEISHGALTLIAGCKADEESTDLGSNGALTAALKKWIDDNTFSTFLATCFNYSEGVLSKLKADLTTTIESEGVTTQDPQISYDKGTAVIPSRTPVIPVTPVTQPQSNFSLEDLFAFLENGVERHKNKRKAGSTIDTELSVQDVGILFRQPAIVVTPPPHAKKIKVRENSKEKEADEKQKVVYRSK